MNFNEVRDYVKEKYSEPHRFYHTLAHIDKMLEHLDRIEWLNPEEKDILRLAIYFHDYVYYPWLSNNEESSIEQFYLYYHNHDIPQEYYSKVVELIKATKKHEYTGDKLVDVMIDLDLDILNSHFPQLIEWEHAIFKEYQYVPIADYVKGRVKFLENIKEKTYDSHFAPDSTKNLHYLIEYVKTRKYKIGIYPGSFNPMHIGHLDILKKSERLFDKVIVARGYNPQKDKPSTPLPHSIPNETIEYDSLVTELFKPIPNINVEFTMIRGFRNGYDIPAEENMKAWIRDIDPTIQFIYITSDPQYEHVSSSSIRDLSVFDSNFVKGYIVP